MSSQHRISRKIRMIQFKSPTSFSKDFLEDREDFRKEEMYSASLSALDWGKLKYPAVTWNCQPIHWTRAKLSFAPKYWNIEDLGQYTAQTGHDPCHLLRKDEEKIINIQMPCMGPPEQIMDTSKNRAPESGPAIGSECSTEWNNFVKIDCTIQSESQKASVRRPYHHKLMRRFYVKRKTQHLVSCVSEWVNWSNILGTRQSGSFWNAATAVDPTVPVWVTCVA